MATTMQNEVTTMLDCLNDSISTNSTLPPCIPEVDQTRLLIRNIMQVFVSVITVLVMIGIGCSVEIKKVVQHLRKPTGIIIGVVCQFVIMPVLAYAWAKIFNMESPETLSVLIVGSCPGGTFSNVLCYWIRADMELSVVMTTTSILLSLGMIPLLLHLYTLLFGLGGLHVPFATIGITIAMIIVPLAVGTLIRYKYRSLALKILRVTGVFGLVSMVILIGLSIYTFYVYWRVDVGLIVTAACFPISGILLGYLISSAISIIGRTLYIPHSQRKAISLETGIQNIQVAGAIVQLSGWSLEFTGRAVLFLLLYSVSQMIWSLIYVVSYMILYFARHRMWPNYQVDEDQEEDALKKEPESKENGMSNSSFELKET